MKIGSLFLFGFCVAASMALTQDQKDKIEKISIKCREEAGVPLELVEKARNGEFVDDSRLKKDILCVSKKLGLVTEDGEVVVDVLEARIKAATSDQEEVQKVYQKCVVKKDTPEDSVFNAIKCLYKNLPSFSPVE